MSKPYPRSALLALTLVASAGGAVAGPQPQVPCNLPEKAGRHVITVASGGVDRTVVMYVPYQYTGTQRLPLVLTLHGSASTAAEQLDRSQWEGEAEARGLFVLSPQGRLPAQQGFAWNVPGVTAVPQGMTPPDDVQFITDAIASVSKRLCVDERRVYATGYSGGGRMVAQYACQHADRVAAIGLVAGLRAGVPRKNDKGQAEPDPATCKPTRPVPVIAFGSTTDKVNPYDGGGAPYWQYGVAAAQLRWAELNRCQVGPETKDVTPATKLVSYDACAEQARVLLYLTAGAGHAWPGSRILLAEPSVLTPVPFDIEATPTMWRFFEGYRTQTPAN